MKEFVKYLKHPPSFNEESDFDYIKSYSNLDISKDYNIVQSQKYSDGKGGMFRILAIGDLTTDSIGRTSRFCVPQMRASYICDDDYAEFCIIDWFGDILAYALDDDARKIIDYLNDNVDEEVLENYKSL